MKKFLLAIICTVLFTSHADAQYLGLNPTDCNRERRGD